MIDITAYAVLYKNKAVNFPYFLKLVNSLSSFVKRKFLSVWNQIKIIIWGHQKSKILIGAQNIILGIKTKKFSSLYSHSNIIDPYKGLYEVDCSGFVNNILKEQKLLNALFEIQNFINSQENIPHPIYLDPWPLHYVLFISSQTPKKYWQTIWDVKLLQPGDIIAYYSASNKNLSSEHGQHVMIVSDAIKCAPDSSCIWVPIFDSTKKPHGSSDIRENGNGIGQGTIGLEINEHGTPTELLWHPESKYKLKCKIAMARIL